ncbi:MAG: hypothetical protein WA874_02230 [Chryseosolibacter sp.]
MYKSVIILLTFLAYSMTLVHSVVPHHHDEEANTGHHHHGNGDHHHHDDHDQDKKTISHVFADAIHHPASEIVIQPTESVRFHKKHKTVDILIVKLNELLIPVLKPPDRRPMHQEKYYSSYQDSFFLLRAPPAA